jgi:hypothetical protein
MSQHQQYILIDEVINGYIDRSEQGVHKFFKLWHIAFDGMTQLGLDFFYQIKSVKLPINANLTVDLPADYLNYSKVGVFNAQGEVIPLAYNSKLTTYADLNPDRIEKTQDDTLFNMFQFNTPVWYNFWSGNQFINLYGLPSGAPFVGSFKIDGSNGVILLNEGFVYEYLVLEYIASPQEGGQYYIPIQFKEALMWYLAWQDIAMMPNTRRGNLGDKEQRRRNFFNERRLGWSRFRPFRLEEAYEWNLTNQRLTVKA